MLDERGRSMAAAVGKGSAQNINSIYFKPMLRKAYHRKSSTSRPDMVGDSSVKLSGGGGGEEVKASCKNNNKSFVNARGEFENDDDDVMMNFWVPDNRTGIYYPKGQERVMEDVSPLAGKDYGVNWFSNP